MAAAEKRNPELPGVERPTIETLERVFAPWLEAKEDAREVREQVKTTRQAATEAMRAIADKLDRDAHGNPVYVYRDGTKSTAIKLVTSTKLVTEVLDDGSGDDEDMG